MNSFSSCMSASPWVLPMYTEPLVSARSVWAVRWSPWLRLECLCPWSFPGSVPGFSTMDTGLTGRPQTPLDSILVPSCWVCLGTWSPRFSSRSAPGVFTPELGASRLGLAGPRGGGGVVAFSPRGVVAVPPGVMHEAQLISQSD